MVVKFRQMYMAVDTLSCIQTHFYAQKCYSVYSYSVTIYIAEKNCTNFFFSYKQFYLRKIHILFVINTQFVQKYSLFVQRDKQWDRTDCSFIETASSSKQNANLSEQVSGSSDQTTNSSEQALRLYGDCCDIRILKMTSQSLKTITDLLSPIAYQFYVTHYTVQVCL